MFISSQHKILFFWSIILTSGILLFAWCWSGIPSFYEKKSPPINRALPLNQQAAPQNFISGLSAKFYEKEKLAVTFAADIIRSQKSKLGFLQIQLFNEIDIKNATLTFHLPESSNDPMADPSSILDKRVFLGSLKIFFQYEDNLLVAVPLFPGLGMKFLTSIHAGSLSLTIQTDKKILVKLTANDATYKPGDDFLRMTGRVRLRSRMAKLETNELYFYPESLTLVTKDDFHFASTYGSFSGKGLTTDLLMTREKTFPHNLSPDYLSN